MGRGHLDPLRGTVRRTSWAGEVGGVTRKSRAEEEEG